MERVAEERPDMIGAQQADMTILVVSARRGEFVDGFDPGGEFDPWR